MLHDPAPDTALYVPATHAVHVPPFGPVKPTSHAQSEEASLPAGEDDPTMMPSRQLCRPCSKLLPTRHLVSMSQYSFMES